MNAPSGTKYCATCGTEIDDSQVYCSDECANRQSFRDAQDWHYSEIGMHIEHPACPFSECIDPHCVAAYLRWIGSVYDGVFEDFHNVADIARKTGKTTNISAERVIELDNAIEMLIFQTRSVTIS